MFRGHFEHAVDDKGRVAVPIQFREALSGLQEERLVATKFRIDGHRCLDVYPLSAWRRLENSLLAKNRFDPRYVRFRNVYVSHTSWQSMGRGGCCSRRSCVNTRVSRATS